MLAKKIVLFLLKALGVYILIFLLWLVIAPFYLHLIAFASSQLLPVVLVGDYRVQSYEVIDQSNGSQRNLLRYYIRVSPKVRNWIEFGTTDLTYPIVTFFTLVLVTPKLSWKRRAKTLVGGFLALWLFYSSLALLFFRVIDFVDGRGLSHLGFIENTFGIERLARWKISGGIAILSGQMVPVAVWFMSVFSQLGIRSKPELKQKNK